MVRPGSWAAVALAAALLGSTSTLPVASAGPTPATDTVALPAASADAGQGDGPHASAKRPVAPVQVIRRSGARIVRFDLGNLDLTSKPGQYVTPLRGSLVLPDAGTAAAPLVVVGHLRSFGCSGDVFAYPCPAGQKELQLERGMEYVGIALARAGYATVIPDLSPTLLAATSTSNYPMGAAYVKVHTAIRDRLLRASKNASDRSFGPGIVGRIKAGPAAQITHSRSGLFAPDLIKAWRTGPTPIKSLLAVAPAYDVGTGNWSPPQPDVRYLTLTGDSDDDVGPMGNQLLAHHIGVRRTTPALAVTVPGYGHMLFNSLLANQDERKDCDAKVCPNASAHQALLVKAATNWVGGGAGVPMRGTDRLPTSLWGVPASILASSNGPAMSLVAGTAAEKAAVSVKGTSSVCSVADPANPAPPPGTCPSTDEATVLTQDVPMRHVQLGDRGSITYRVTPLPKPVGTIAVHLTPFGNRTAGKPLTLAWRDSAGHSCTRTLAGTLPALRSQKTATSNGLYIVESIRVPLSGCTTVDPARITSVSLRSPGGARNFLLRGVDLVERSAAAGRPSGARGSARAGGAGGAGRAGGTGVAGGAGVSGVAAGVRGGIAAIPVRPATPSVPSAAPVTPLATTPAASPTATAPTTAATPAPTAIAAPSTNPAPSAQESDHSRAIWVSVVVGTLLPVAAGIAAWLVSRRRRDGR